MDARVREDTLRYKQALEAAGGILGGLSRFSGSTRHFGGR